MAETTRGSRGGRDAMIVAIAPRTGAGPDRARKAATVGT